MEQFNGNALFFQCCQDSIYHLSLVIQPTAAITEAVIGGNISVPLFASEIKLMLNGGFPTHAMFRETGNHPFEEGTRAGFPGDTIGANHIAHHTTCMWNIR